MHQQRLVKRVFFVTADKATANQRIGVDGGNTEALALVVFHAHLFARGEILQWRNGHIDFVGIDPEMAFAQATVFMSLEFECGKYGHFGIPLKKQTPPSLAAGGVVNVMITLKRRASLSWRWMAPT